MKRHAIRSCSGMIIAALSLAVPPLSAQTTPKRTPEQIQASYAAHKGEFDYLLGDWEFTATSKQYGKFRGLWSAVRLDKGQILDIEPGKRLRYSHYSPLAGVPDKPENYHHVTIELETDGPLTHVTLSQDNNADEKAKAHSEKNWSMMLDGLKHYVEDPKG